MQGPLFLIIFEQRGRIDRKDEMIQCITTRPLSKREMKKYDSGVLTPCEMCHNTKVFPRIHTDLTSSTRVLNL